MDIKILKDLFQVTIERGNSCNRHNQTIRKRIMVDLGLLKSKKVELRSTIVSEIPEEISWDTLRTPSFVSSSTSVSPENKYYGKQDPWKSAAGKDRSGQLDKETDLFESSRKRSDQGDLISA